jgi:hypothetical protein
LSLFEYVASVVVLIATLEPNAAVSTGNLCAGKPPCIVQYIPDCLPDFAILTGCRSHRFMLCIIEIVNSLRAVWMHRHSDPHGITRSLLWGLAKSGRVATNQKSARDSQLEREKFHDLRSLR